MSRFIVKQLPSVFHRSHETEDPAEHQREQNRRTGEGYKSVLRGSPDQVDEGNEKGRTEHQHEADVRDALQLVCAGASFARKGRMQCREGEQNVEPEPERIRDTAGLERIRRIEHTVLNVGDHEGAQCCDDQGERSVPPVDDYGQTNRDEQHGEVHHRVAE